MGILDKGGGGEEENSKHLIEIPNVQNNAGILRDSTSFFYANGPVTKHKDKSVLRKNEVQEKPF